MDDFRTFDFVLDFRRGQDGFPLCQNAHVVIDVFVRNQNLARVEMDFLRVNAADEMHVAVLPAQSVLLGIRE